MYSITLQSSDSIITSGDTIGQLQFAASSESDGSAATQITGSVYFIAEGSFQTASNPTSFVIATSAADGSKATERWRFAHNRLLPFGDTEQDIGEAGLQIRNVFIGEGVVLASNTPSSTTNKLYNEGGTLKFNGSAVGGGGGGSMTTVKSNGSQVGGADIVTLDFSSNFTATETPDTEINIELASSVSTDTLTLTKAYKSSVETNSDGATITFDLNESNLHEVTLGGGRTLAISNETVGQRFIVKLIQDGTGSRTVTWFSTIKWPGGLEPTLTETAGKADYFSFVVTGTDTYDGFVIGYNL
ncbi:hypothetical protein OAK92_00820 [Crocinitomicaceae bacterium]|nr:hypothetical protein [Crocinitomicaceae bacterium]